MLVWPECTEKAPSVTTKDTGTLDNQALSVRKTELLHVFFLRYYWGFPLELTPSGHTFALLGRAREKKIAGFIPISRVSSVIDVKDPGTDHIRIKGTSGD